MQSVAREAWTDERLDDLTQRVDEGFNRTEREFQAVRLEMRTEFAAVRSEMKTEFSSARSEIGELRSEVVEVRSDINALTRTIAQAGFGMAGALLIGFLGVIATQL